METVVLPLSAIRVDEANPRPVDEMGDLDALAESFELTPGRPGEPLNPIVAWRDGNVARIADGERRFRAMSRAGRVDKCTVHLYEMDERDAMLAFLSTNDKLPLSPAAMSRGVQQVMALGVDTADVDRAVGRRGAAAGMRSALARGAKAEQVTLEQAMAVKEAEDDGDERGADAIAKASAKSWEQVASNARHRRAVWAEAAETCAALAAAGFAELAEEPPHSGAGAARWKWVGRPGDVARFVESLDEGAERVGYFDKTGDKAYQASVYAYWRDADEAEQEAAAVEAANEREQRLAEAEEFAAKVNSVRLERFAWMSRVLEQGTCPAALRDELAARWRDELPGDVERGLAVVRDAAEAGKVTWDVALEPSDADLLGAFHDWYPGSWLSQGVEDWRFLLDDSDAVAVPSRWYERRYRDRVEAHDRLAELGAPAIPLAESVCELMREAVARADAARAAAAAESAGEGGE